MQVKDHKWDHDQGYDSRYTVSLVDNAVTQDFCSFDKAASKVVAASFDCTNRLEYPPLLALVYEASVFVCGPLEYGQGSATQTTAG